MTAPHFPQTNTEASSLHELLAARIRSDGPLTFADFMEECLYHPQHGYYSRPASPRFGDYYTSVDVHPVFGRLLARQLEQIWRLLGSPGRFVAVEAGAGVGRLCRHILDFSAREFQDFYSALNYLAVERSAARRGEHGTELAGHVEQGKVSSAEKIPENVAFGCIFSNELFDALPTHRVKMKDGKLQEICVGIENGQLIEVIQEPSTPALAEYFVKQGISLQEDAQAEACLQACSWIENAGRALERGFVMSIDYGHEASGLYSQSHNRGTLLAYRDHCASEKILDRPGEQDLTAHVNFTALDLWGRGSGLQRTGLVTQSEFLVALGRANEFDDLYDPGQSDLDKLRARLLLKNLIHPEGLGEKFQVLIQHKGIEDPRLTGLSGY